MVANFCANCGTPLLAGAGFCGNCGAPVAGAAATAVQTDAPAAVATEASPAETSPPKVGFHWGYAFAALVIALVGFVATANGGTARLVGIAMMAVVAVGALISGGYRHMEELSGLPAFIAKLPGYCFVGVFLVMASGSRSYAKRRSEE